MFRRVSAIVIFFAAGAGALQAQRRLPADESLVVAAALDAYVGQMFGSGGRLLLHQTTIKPSPAQLEVHVFSPANEAAAQRYGAADIGKLRGRLQRASAATVNMKSPRYVISIWQRKECREFPPPRFLHAISVSPPA